MTSAEQAVSTVGGSQENGIIHVLLARSVYLSFSASLPRLSRSTRQHFALKTSALEKKEGRRGGDAALHPLT